MLILIACAMLSHDPIHENLDYLAKRQAYHNWIYGNHEDTVVIEREEDSFGFEGGVPKFRFRPKENRDWLLPVAIVAAGAFVGVGIVAASLFSRSSRGVAGPGQTQASHRSSECSAPGDP